MLIFNYSNCISVVVDMTDIIDSFVALKMEDVPIGIGARTRLGAYRLQQRTNSEIYADKVFLPVSHFWYLRMNDSLFL